MMTEYPLKSFIGFPFVIDGKIIYIQAKDINEAKIIVQTKYGK